MFEIGDFVTRKSYNHDVIFKIIKIENHNYYLEGIYTRLIADAKGDDLLKANDETLKFFDEKINNRIKNIFKLSRHKMHMTGKILHIDGDKNYLDKCLALYEKLKLKAYGVYMEEGAIKDHILELIDKLDPDIFVLTGHDAYNQQGIKDLNNYRNTSDYIEAVKLIRKHYSKDHILVFAGACQSNFEALMAAGANFASSPKRVNIDAYDPAIIAIKAATTPFSSIISLEEVKSLIDNEKQGVSGIESYGKMRLFL